MPLPDFVNFYAVIINAESKVWLADEFAKAGWTCRKNSWVDYDVNKKWAELEITGKSSEILLHGSIDTKYFEELNNYLIRLDCNFTSELYNRDQELIKTTTNN